MSILSQKTLNNPFSFKGVGLHNGKVSNVNVLPSTPNAGITLKRTDIDKNNIIVQAYLMFPKQISAPL